MCQGRCRHLGTNFRGKRTVEGLDEDEVTFLNSVLNMQYFSYGNFFRYMCSGATTSPCESFFSTWHKHGRDKSHRNEGWYVITTILRNVIEVNARRSSEQSHALYQPFNTWTNIMEEVLLKRGCNFDLDDFVNRNQGILCEKEIKLALRNAFPIASDTAGMQTTEQADHDISDIVDIADETGTAGLGAFDDSEDDDDVDVASDQEDDETYIGEDADEGETGTSIYGRRRRQMDYTNPSRARDSSRKRTGENELTGNNKRRRP